ncbi:hypothetical protein PV797_20000 [Clostridiaceae bacterium M8S5]|nr:hypothetical protein PV797_20000 [Clostridiaceae bacterium M8S5]
MYFSYYNPNSFNINSFSFVTSPRWTDFQNWMGNSSDAIKNLALNKLSLPGTHDSGTYELFTDEIYNVNDFTGIAPTIAGPIIRAMAVTQNANIYTQLLEGNRYIDLRFAKDQKGRIRIVHTVFGNSATNVFEQIATFLNNNPNEVVIIDIQSINNLNDSDQINLKATILNTIGKYLASRNSLSTKSTLNDFYKAGKNAVLLYTNSNIVDSEPLYWYRNNSTILNPWYNTNDYNYLISQIDTSLKNLPSIRDYIYVSQLILTINSSEIRDIILNLLKWLPIPIYGQIRFTEEFNKLVNTPGIYNLISPHFQHIEDWLKAHSPTINPGPNAYFPNIIIQDFYQRESIKTIIGYNTSYGK